MDASLAWSKLAERAAYSGFVRVRVDTYRTGSGSVSDWDVIEQDDCVFVLAFTEAGTALVFEQFRVGPRRVLPELPGGLVDPGEEPVAAGLRELREETGFAGAAHWYAGSEWVAASSTRRKHAVIVGGCRRVAEPEWGADESGVVREVEPGALLTALLNGEQSDSGAGMRALLRFARANEVPAGLTALQREIRTALCPY